MARLVPYYDGLQSVCLPIPRPAQGICLVTQGLVCGSCDLSKTALHESDIYNK